MNFDLQEENLIITPYKSNESIYVREQKGGVYQKKYDDYLVGF